MRGIRLSCANVYHIIRTFHLLKVIFLVLNSDIVRIWYNLFILTFLFMSVHSIR